MSKTPIFALAALALLTASACGGYPPPNARVATAEASIRGAMEAGATEIPRAQLHLRLAQEQTDKAKRLMQDGYNERADWALRRAESDAELATAIARENQTIEAANAAKEKLNKLKMAPN